jgi:hypothetical protein
MFLCLVDKEVKKSVEDNLGVGGGKSTIKGSVEVSTMSLLFAQGAKGGGTTRWQHMSR